MAHRDLREFLEFLDKKDHLLRIKTEVNRTGYNEWGKGFIV